MQIARPGLLKKLGHIVQIAFVPADFDAALSYWTGVMGAGPFYELRHIPLDNVRYHGTASPVDISAVLGYWGDIQIELVKQHDEAPSIYRDWLKASRTGVQHLGVVVDDFDAAHALLRENGGVPVQEMEIPETARAAYFQLPGEDPLIEILGLRSEFRQLWDHMRETARAWDGVSEPVRAVPDRAEWVVAP